MMTSNTTFKLNNGEVVSQDICHSTSSGMNYSISKLEKKQFLPKNVNKTVGRNEVLMEIGPDANGSRTCAFFYCQKAICPGTEEMRYLAMKEKLIEQYTSDKQLYECSLPPSQCALNNVKKTLADYLLELLSRANGTFPKLNERTVDLSTLLTRPKWIPSAPERHERVGGSIMSWILSMLFLIFILLTAQSVSQYGEHRVKVSQLYTKFQISQKNGKSWILHTSDWETSRKSSQRRCGKEAKSRQRCRLRERFSGKRRRERNGNGGRRRRDGCSVQWHYRLQTNHLIWNQSRRRWYASERCSRRRKRRARTQKQCQM